MIKLKDIKVIEVYDTCINTLGETHNNKSIIDETMDFILCIDYKVDIEKSQLKNYELNELELEDLEDTFSSYLVAHINRKPFENLDEASYKEIGFNIVSDVCPGVEEANNELPEKQQQIAFSLIKEYILNNGYHDKFIFNN